MRINFDAILAWLTYYPRKIFWPEKKPTLEDGEIIMQDDGVYQRCPECDILTPQLVECPDFDKMKPGDSIIDMEAEPGNLQPLFDLRHCITGIIDYDSKVSRLHQQCPTCGQAMKDENGNTLFIE